MNEPKASRGTPREESPYLWLTRNALRRIREGIGQTKGASAVAVYVALCDLASERGSPTFSEAIAVIAMRAALSYRATAPALDALAGLGLICVMTNERRTDAGKVERLPSTYSIVSTAPPTAKRAELLQQKMPEGLGTRDGASFAEMYKELPNGSSEKEIKGSRFAPPKVDEVRSEAEKIGLPESEADKFHDYFESCGWVIGKGKPMKSWQPALRNWQRRSGPHLEGGKNARIPSNSRNLNTY